MQPIFLGRLLQYYTSNSDATVTKQTAYLYAAGVVLCSGILIFFTHPYMMGILHMGMKLRVACCTLIYRKALKLSRIALGETTVGQAVNLLSNDVNRFDISLIYLHYLWIGPLETIIIAYLMYREVELSAIFGIIVLLLFIPLQGNRNNFANVSLNITRIIFFFHLFYIMLFSSFLYILLPNI